MMEGVSLENVLCNCIKALKRDRTPQKEVLCMLVDCIFYYL